MYIMFSSPGSLGPNPRLFSGQLNCVPGGEAVRIGEGRTQLVRTACFAWERDFTDLTTAVFSIKLLMSSSHPGIFVGN